MHGKTTIKITDINVIESLSFHEVDGTGRLGAY
jgi:hypothetical protein